MALNQAKIIMVTSVKGGTGKTTTVLNLAGIFALEKEKVLVVDLDLYSGSIGASLNIPKGNNIYTMCEDMANNHFKNLEDYIQSYNEYIDVLLSPLDPRSVGKINKHYIDTILTRLSLKYKYILIDSNHITDKTNLIALDHSTTALYIITGDLMDIKNMKTMVNIYKDMEKTNYKIVLNESINYSKYSSYDIEGVLGRNIDYIIPRQVYNKNIDKYVFSGKIMTMDNQTKYDIYKEIIKDIK